MIVKNVSELIEHLKTLDPNARVFTTEPPFYGLRLVPQDDGSFLFCRPEDPGVASGASINRGAT